MKEKKKKERKGFLTNYHTVLNRSRARLIRPITNYLCPIKERMSYHRLMAAIGLLIALEKTKALKMCLLAYYLGSQLSKFNENGKKTGSVF